MQKWLWKWLAGFGLLITLAASLFYLSDTPPVPEITEARMRITEAEKLNSDRYAAALFSRAQQVYDSAMSEWQLENSKLFFLRDFTATRSHALESGRLARVAAEKSKTALSNQKQLADNQLSALRDRFATYNKLYGNVPLQGKYSSDLANAKLLFQEGIQAYRSDNYQLAIEKLNEAELTMATVAAFSEGLLKTYFQAYPDWKEWVKQSIKDSQKQKTYCIIVDKYARKCMLYKGGMLQHIYEMELGPNWIGDKLHRGDKSTPEGFYKIVKKKSGAETRYYKAFLLDYPNEGDKKRFAFNKKNGHIRKDAIIGGLIEIHGHGGKGTDWTEGCIALTDAEMDELYSLCSIGTTVTIVGSLTPFQELARADD